MKISRLFFSAVACAALMTGCSDDDGPAPTALAFTDSEAYNIPTSTVGTAITDINVAPGASGGKTPYTFTATGLPAGIAINTAGMISGTPTSVAAAGNATVTVKDSSTPVQSKNITIAFGAVSLVTYAINVTDDGNARRGL